MEIVQSVDRALLILEIIAENTEGIGITDISTISGIHKSTVHRLVTTLQANDYIEQGENNKYKITFKLYELGSKILANVDVIDVAKPFIEKLAKEVNEVVHLVVRNKNEIVYVDKVEANTNTMMMGSSVGKSSPLYCTSVGKAILSNSNLEDIEKVWASSNILKLTEKTIVDYDAFLEELHKTKDRGYAIDDEENEIGVRCVGAPIFDRKGDVIAAISISGPSFRVTYDNLDFYTKRLKEAAGEISKNMGYIERK